METETRELNCTAALALAILEDAERALAACSGLGDLPACEARLQRMLREFGLSEREVVTIGEIRNDEEEKFSLDAEEALACAVLEEASRRGAGDLDDYTAALWELSAEHDLDSGDLLDAEEALGWWSPDRVEDPGTAHDCAIVTEVRRRAELHQGPGCERDALAEVATEQGLSHADLGSARLVAAERLTGLAVWRCRWCHRLTGPEDRPRGGRPYVEGVGVERRIWRVACRECSGTAWCVAGRHDWDAAAFDPVPVSCPDHT